MVRLFNLVRRSLTLWLAKYRPPDAPKDLNYTWEWTQDDEQSLNDQLNLQDRTETPPNPDLDPRAFKRKPPPDAR